MSDTAEIVPRHLVFVLMSGETVVQRGATIVENIENGERHLFSDFDRDHNITDFELQVLLDNDLIMGFDDLTVWLYPPAAPTQLTYYFLDTRLSPPYQGMVDGLLQSATLEDRYQARVRMGRVAIMGKSGDPFSTLPEAEAALTLVKNALAEQLPALSIEKLTLNPRAQETQTINLPDFNNLIREQPAATLTDRRVLIVQADATRATTIHQALEEIGLQTRIALQGETALEILLDEEPDLLILDLNLPDMHGYEIVAKIRKDPLLARIPIITLSPYNSEADVVFALYVARVDEFLTHPVEPITLRQRAVTLLKRHD